MANWTDLSGAFGYGTKLTSQQMQQLRDNITALAEDASGAPDIAWTGFDDIDTPGNSNYMDSTHDFGGNEQNDAYTTWTRICGLRALCKGEFRFYWGYRMEYNNVTGYWRVKKNGTVIVGPLSDTGTSGSDPFHYRTDDIALDYGDQLEWEVYDNSAEGTCDTKIYLRGTTRHGTFDFGTDQTRYAYPT